MSDDLVAVTVRLPQAQIDALDAMNEAGEIPNRSEGIRASVGFALDSDEFEVSSNAQKLAQYQRTRRLSKVEFYKTGFRQQVRRVIGTVASTSPPWPPEDVRETLPRIFDSDGGESQIVTLFDTEERRNWARDVMSEEIDRYAEAFDEADVEDGNPYLDALAQDVDGDESVIERAYGDANADQLVPEAVRMLDDDEPITVAQKLSKRKGVDVDKAAEVVDRAQQQQSVQALTAGATGNELVVEEVSDD